MIRTLHRVRGASALGARQPGEPGPFGVRPDPDEDDPDDGHDDKEPSSSSGAGSDH
ncbi:hypothetical protein [Streptomyces sp. UG1]|uniref:hypothetical protein n=1 Tax=Streptomyces sp. UG1 TaxID=3417652 RepID=UPI003CFA9935